MKVTDIPRLLMKLRFPGVHTISLSYFPVCGVYRLIMRRSGGPEFLIPLHEELLEDVYRGVEGAEAAMVDYIIREYNGQLKEELLTRYESFLEEKG